MCLLLQYLAYSFIFLYNCYLLYLTQLWGKLIVNITMSFVVLKLVQFGVHVVGFLDEYSSYSFFLMCLICFVRFSFSFLVFVKFNLFWFCYFFGLFLGSPNQVNPIEPTTSVNLVKSTWSSKPGQVGLNKSKFDSASRTCLIFSLFFVKLFWLKRCVWQTLS